MSDFAEGLNAWIAGQAKSTVEEQVIAAYSEANPPPDGQEWFISGQEHSGDEVAYRFDLRPTSAE